MLEAYWASHYYDLRAAGKEEEVEDEDEDFDQDEIEQMMADGNWTDLLGNGG